MLNENFPTSAIVIVIIVIIIGFIITGFGVKSLIAAHQSESWPTTKGVITYSWVSEERESDGEHYRYTVTLAYDYAVHTKKFDTREEIDLTQAEANALREQFPEGLEVDVYYNPKYPRTSFLVPRLQGHWSLVIFGLFFSSLSASFLIFAGK